MRDILALDATAQLQLLESKRIGAFDLLAENQAALNSRNAGLNAVIAADFERAQARARAIDDHRARGDHLGLLAGLPMTVKDSFDVEGLPATAALGPLRPRKAFDAQVVAKARAQDAVIWGKTNTPGDDRDWQTAEGLYGATNNPYDAARTCGGASGGSAAAVAAGLSALEIGSDASGGLRVPASFCGVFAHRPTEGLVDNRGHVPPPPGLSAERDLLVPGPVARSARDLRLLLACMAEAPVPAKAAAFDLKALKVGLWTEAPGFALDGEVRGMVEGFASRLAKEGAQVQPLSLPMDLNALLLVYAELLGMAEAQDLTPQGFRGQRLRRGLAQVQRALGFSPWSAGGRVLARTASHRHWLEANEMRARLRRAAKGAFSSCQVIIAPCTTVTAFRHQQSGKALQLSGGGRVPYAALAQWSALAAICGLPATIVPAGLTPSGLPVGVQIIGPRGADSRTLAVAQAIEEQIGGFTPPPPSPVAIP